MPANFSSTSIGARTDEHGEERELAKGSSMSINTCKTCRKTAATQRQNLKTKERSPSSSMDSKWRRLEGLGFAVPGSLPWESARKGLLSMAKYHGGSSTELALIRAYLASGQTVVITLQSSVLEFLASYLQLTVEDLVRVLMVLKAETYMAQEAYKLEQAGELTPYFALRMPIRIPPTVG
jgi:hypothetical protein